MSARKTKLTNPLTMIVIGLLFATTASTTAQPLQPGYVDDFAGKPRVVVLSDMGNEPDDQMSFVRLLLYSNELGLEGLIATTSTWQRNIVQTEPMRKLVAAYGEVRSNLLKHAAGWPEAAKLDALVASGQPAYGMAAVGSNKMSPGAEAIIRAADRSDPRPLWITIWGGANTLAQSLLHVRTTRAPAEIDKFVSELRVSSISDQDDAGSWIRREFPSLHYIVKPSSADSGEYVCATWTRINGDYYYRNCAGADSTTVTNEWLKKTYEPKARWVSYIRRSLSLWKATLPPFSASQTTASTAIAIRAGAAGADVTSIGSRMARRTRFGRRAAIFSVGSHRKTASLATMARPMCRIRRRSGAGAQPFSMSSPRA